MKKVILTSCMVLAIAACDKQQKEKLGLAKAAPDEFSVITRAPLSVPPDFHLRPPRPGTQRPMEISTKESARQTVFGVNDIDGSGVARAEKSETSDDFLGKIGVGQADPNIRDVVDNETPTDNRTTAERLLFMKNKEAAEGNPLDPSEEMERLKQDGTITVKKRNEEIPSP